MTIPADLVIPSWLPTPEAIAERERILASQYFLVEIAGNGGIGEIWRCRGCNGKHRYLTLRCVERPFSGLSNGLYAYWRLFGAEGAQAFLSGAQRAKFDALNKAFGESADLSQSHPRTARALQVADRDMDLGAVALGLLEPITQRKAQQLADLINARGTRPPFTLAGLKEAR